MKIVYATFPDLKTAEDISRHLVEQEIVACANVSSEITSIYRWEGKLCQDNEVSAIFKTTAARLDQVISTIIKLHPYETPCVVAWDIVAGNKDFLAWVSKNTSN